MHYHYTANMPIDRFFVAYKEEAKTFFLICANGFYYVFIFKFQCSAFYN